MRCRVAFLALMTSVGFASVGFVSSALAFGEFTSGPWSGAAYFTDGRFTHCGMRATQGAWKLAFVMNEKGSVSLGLLNPKLTFTKGNKLQGWVQLDNGKPDPHTFITTGKEAVGIRLGSADAVQKVVAANRLRIKLGEVMGDFRFAFTRQAFTQLTSCVAKRGV
jgi:hypothetical protein